MSSIGRFRGLLAFAGIVLAATPAWAQEEEVASAPSLQSPNTGPAYQELQLRERVEATRRLDIIEMRGEAARLMANTEELNAQAQNCQARRAAYESGAQVELCENDQIVPGPQASATGASGDAPAATWLAHIEARMSALEQELRKTPVTLSSGPQAEQPGNFRVDTWGAVLLLAGPARAVVRLPGKAGDILYRMPFDARRDGDKCIETVRERSGIPAGTRICRAGLTQ